MINRLILVVVGILAACGGDDTSSNALAGAQQKALNPVIKQDASNYQIAVESLYVAYFGRPADPNGLISFESALQASGAPTDVAELAVAYSTNPAVKNLIDGFGSSAESQSLYGNGSTAAFVAAVFQNVVGRAPQNDGLNFWVNAINDGTLSQGDAALSIMAGALANKTSQGLIDANLINNRLAVAVAFTSGVLSNNAVNAYSGAAAAAGARSMLNRVGATTNPASYESVINAAIATIISITPNNNYVVTTLAGTPTYDGENDGIGPLASFFFPTGIATDAAGNIYVSDSVGNTIRKITPTGAVSTLAGQPGRLGYNAGYTNGKGSDASFSNPAGLAVDLAGNIYVADEGSDQIRLINPEGVVTTFFSLSGIYVNYGSVHPYGIAIDSAGDVYISCWYEHTIRKITQSGSLTIFAGKSGISGSADGVGSSATFNNPAGLTIDSSGNLYVADSSNNTIRKISPGGVVSTLAGTAGVIGSADGVGSNASFNLPMGVRADARGNIYVSDTLNDTIRKITPGGNVTTVVGISGVSGYVDGFGAAAELSLPQDVAIDLSGNLYVADGKNFTVRKVTLNGSIASVPVAPVAIDPAPTAAIAIAGATNQFGSIDGKGSEARFGNGDIGLTVDANGNVYVADAGNHEIREIFPDGTVKTIAGQSGETGFVDGVGAAASFTSPIAITVDSSNNLFVSDSYLIREISPSGGVTTIAGQPKTGVDTDGVGAAAAFGCVPTGLAADQMGNVYATELGCNTIRKIAPGAKVTTFAGYLSYGGQGVGSIDATGNAALFDFPQAVTTDLAGNVYVADSLNSTVRKISPDGVVRTFAGSPGQSSLVDGLGVNARFWYPYGLGTDAAGNIYVLDLGQSTEIRKITQQGMVTTISSFQGGAVSMTADSQGNVYFAYAGVIYKIASSLN